jgi:hypothetical protein
MWERLRQPGGTLGRLSLASAVTLAAVGAIGTITLLIGLATGSDFWSDTTSDVVGGLVLFVFTAAGAVRFYLMDRSPWGGAALAVLGGLALTLVLFWAIVPIVVGIGAAVVAVMRARAMSHGTTTAPRAT